MNVNDIILEDCVAGMKKLPAESIDIVVTSPPYNLDISYGTYADNLPRREYLEWLSQVFTEIKRILKPTGHFWLNVGYSNKDPWVGHDVSAQARPLFELQNNFTWVKSIAVNDRTTGHFKPINSERFSTPTWEHLFHFTKTGDVACDRLAIGVPYEYQCNVNDTETRLRGKLVKKLGFKNQLEFNRLADDQQRKELEVQFADRMKDKKPKPTVRCRGNTWFVPYESITSRTDERGSHPATFPILLVEQCIKFSGIKSGVLLDPFMGSGTSAIASSNCGIDWLGFEIDQDYREWALTRIQDHNSDPLKNLFE